MDPTLFKVPAFAEIDSVDAQSITSHPLPLSAIKIAEEHALAIRSGQHRIIRDSDCPYPVSFAIHRDPTRVDQCGKVYKTLTFAVTDTETAVSRELKMTVDSGLGERYPRILSIDDVIGLTFDTASSRVFASRSFRQDVNSPKGIRNSLDIKVVEHDGSQHIIITVDPKKEVRLVAMCLGKHQHIRDATKSEWDLFHEVLGCPTFTNDLVSPRIVGTLLRLPLSEDGNRYRWLHS